GERLESLVGLQSRYDDILNGLFHTKARVVLSTTREDHIDQLSAAPYAQVRANLTPWFRAVVGLRYDAYRFHVRSDQPLNSGSESRSSVSPKLSLTFGPWEHSEIYLNYGDGFHSNDARGTTIRVDPRTGELVERVSPLVRARGYDVGARTSLGSRVQ